jgi:prophage regulatory protein
VPTGRAAYLAGHVPGSSGTLHLQQEKANMAAQIQAALTILRRKQVEARTGLSRSTIYAKLRCNPKRPTDYDPTFPKPVSVGAKAVGWIEAEINDWLTAQIAKSRKA